MTSISNDMPCKTLSGGLFWFGAITALAISVGAVMVSAAEEPVTAAKFRGRQPVTPAPDGTLFCEAEEFSVEKPGWQARAWGENYYAGTFANTFLSRKAFLGAAEDCEETVATIEVNVAEAGRYLVLVRYEAAYRFQTQFRVKIEQAGRVRMDRLYGAGQREDLAFRPAFTEGGGLVLGHRRKRGLGGTRCPCRPGSRAGEDHSHCRPATGSAGSAQRGPGDAHPR